MVKKIYNAPYMKVITVQNDIIATSDPGISTAQSFSTESWVGAQGRQGWDDFDE